MLVAARLAQGIAAGALAPQNSALIQQLFRGAERGTGVRLLRRHGRDLDRGGPGRSAASSSRWPGGPGGWRWIFYVNVPIGVVALVLAARLLPRDDRVRAGTSTSWASALLGGGVLALMLPLVQAESGGLARLWWLFPVGARAARRLRAVGAAGRAPRRGAAAGPAADHRTPGYATGAALGTVYFIGFSGIWLVFALFFQTGLGWTPLQSGLAVTPFALGSAVSAVFGGRLVDRYGRRLTVIGLTGVLVGIGGGRASCCASPRPSRWAGRWRPRCCWAGSAAAW